MHMSVQWQDNKVTEQVWAVFEKAYKFSYAM